ncbi:MAG: cation:proton antiporter [Bryobacteraceae bacterium]
MRFVLLLALAGLMDAARSFAPLASIGSGAAGTALAFGFLLLAAFFLGSLFKQIGLPRLTGYIVAGIVAGPQVLGLVSTPMVANLKIFNGVATALIALTAGVELDLRAMRPLFRSIAWLIVVAILGTAVLLTGTVYLSRGLLPFMAGLNLPQSWAVAATLAVTMVAQSPAVVVALRSEMEADGPLTRTVLGVVVMSDLVVIILFAVVSTITKTFFGSEADAVKTAMTLTWEVPGSMLAGLLIGIVASAFLRYVKRGTALFVVTVAFVIAEVGQRIDFDPLIVALMVGLYVRNLTPWGERLYAEAETASLPVYVVFFAVTGATIHLNELALVAAPAVIFVAARATGFLAGATLAGWLAHAPDAVRKYAGLGLTPQAGLALALALLFVRTFPNFGAGAAALVRSGEAGKLTEPKTEPVA